ncbi:acyl-[acyl-carrier-protein] thioesterase [Butyrivibrio sp. AE3004]|uniref:acyl-[acyl-carrier-protein] thioesterase n=1 Tax=Butyrivibrio sp. AE3004 TaxID=1506994 RepID=UPI00049420DE|nr:acyl-ACP thioesterase domain-containing protein [Butyrivibrio sp. AE3004]
MYGFDSRIRYTETDLQHYLTIESLIDYFQDCSTFQTQEGPATIEKMEKKDIAWVINSWQVVINRLPKLGERVTIGTVPYELKGFIGLRNFFMDTVEGERLAVANSVWSLINMKKGAPTRVDDDIIATYPLDEKLPMDYAPRKIADPEDAKIYNAEVKKVGLHHLDSNNHVNNGQHIRIALGAFSRVAEREELSDLETLSRSREGLQIRAEYRQQAYLGDEINPVIYVKNNVYTAFLNDNKGKPYSIVEIKRIEKC